MSKEQLVNFKFLKQLMNDLAFFGLNPREWRFERSAEVTRTRLTLCHKGDRNFRLKGVVTSLPCGRNRFSELTVVSL